MMTTQEYFQCYNQLLQRLEQEESRSGVEFKGQHRKRWG